MLKDAINQNNIAYSQWVSCGMPEADGILNNNNREVITAYILETPEALGYKFHKGIVDIKTLEKLHNFCCDYIFNGTSENYEKVQKAHEQFTNSGTLEHLDALRETLENAGGICLIWS